MLMVVWFGETFRPTRDIDLLGFGIMSESDLSLYLRAICRLEVEFDGMEYDPHSLRIEEIRNENDYGGRRATLHSSMGASRIPIHIDIGVGDAVVPSPEWIEYPGLLDLPGPRLRAYRKETAISEKLHAMVHLGQVNSRMKDFFDIYTRASREAFEEEPLGMAIRATFERRATPIPVRTPTALTEEFATSREQQAQWKAFLDRHSLSEIPDEFARVVHLIAGFLLPVMEAGGLGGGRPRTWKPGGPWNIKS